MASEKYTIGSTTYTHGTEVVVEPHENSSTNIRKYQGCVGAVCGTGYRTINYDSSYFLVDLGGITIQCDPSEMTALGLRKVVREQYEVRADGKR